MPYLQNLSFPSSPLGHDSKTAAWSDRRIRIEHTRLDDWNGLFSRKQQLDAVRMEYSPALSADADFDHMTDEQLDMHFANYLPLSNLPTPDPAKHFPGLTTEFSKSAAASQAQRHVPELEG